MLENRRVRILIGILAVWGAVAYLVAPWLWERYFRDHSAIEDHPRITTTSDGHAGDPLNIDLVGSEEQVVLAMKGAGWFPADPITLATSLRIAVDSVLGHPDKEAPVSNLFLFGRKQDLAFELPVGDSPRQRHHVRYWKSPSEEGGRPLWLGSATFDVSVGFSYTTGEVTHHIGPDVDAERDRIASELAAADWVLATRKSRQFSRRARRPQRRRRSLAHRRRARHRDACARRRNDHRIDDPTCHASRRRRGRADLQPLHRRHDHHLRGARGERRRHRGAHARGDSGVAALSSGRRRRSRDRLRLRREMARARRLPAHGREHDLPRSLRARQRSRPATLHRAARRAPRRFQCMR